MAGVTAFLRRGPRVAGTAFDLRSRQAAVAAASPRVPPFRQSSADVISVVPPLQFGIGVEAELDYGLDPLGRFIRNDPRDGHYLALPYKLTPQQVLNILRSALAGDLWQQCMLTQLMLDTWPKFRMAQHRLRERAAYAKYVFHPYAEEGEEPSRRAVEKAKLVGRAFRSFAPNPFNDEGGASAMLYDLGDAILNGISVVELTWRTGKGAEMLPKSASWVHPRCFTFNNRGEVALFSNDYGRVAADPRLSQTELRVGTPPAWKFLCGQFKSRSGSSLGAGFMRPLAMAWAARQFCWEWALNTAKKYGSPFLDVTYERGMSGTKELEDLEAFLQKAGEKRTLLHPTGTTVVVEPAQSLGKENPQRYILEESDRLCLFLLLGQAGTTEQTPGKLGNDDTHAEVEDDRERGVAEWLARNPLRQFARAVVEMNYGPEEADVETPEPRPDFTRPLTAQEVGTLATALSTSRLCVRADELYPKLGLTQPDPGDTVAEGGQLVVLSEPMTQEEIADQQFEREQAMAGPQAKAQPVRVNVVKALGAMGEEELERFEDTLRSAEEAAGRGVVNGEWDAVKAALAERGVTKL